MHTFLGTLVSGTDKTRAKQTKPVASVHQAQENNAGQAQPAGNTCTSLPLVLSWACALSPRSLGILGRDQLSSASGPAGEGSEALLCLECDATCLKKRGDSRVLG
jgi:hypothetical protein